MKLSLLPNCAPAGIGPAVRSSFWALILACGAATCAHAESRKAVAAANFAPVLAPAPGQTRVHLNAYRLDARPVTNSEFLQFVHEQPQWRRDQVASLFADNGYLSHWAGAEALGPEAQPDQPVTRVSWFAARAYCAVNGARLPSWNEWEWAAAADEQVGDARANPIWREQILNWYARPATDVLQPVARGRPNLYGIHDLHGLIWEWVDDFGSLMVSNDSRNQGDPDKLEFCGAGSISAQDRENYPVLMRVAFLSALEGRSSARRLGFRCADPVPQGATRTTSALPGTASAGATRPHTAPSTTGPTSAAPGAGMLPGDSLYQLPVDLETDSGAHIPLSSFRGKPLVVTMFYADCNSVCPMLTNQLQNLQKRLSSRARANTHILMVSLDPSHDTAAALSDFRQRHHIGASTWTLARTDMDSVRLLAAVLGIRYRQLPDQTFNHSTIITLTNPSGVIQARSVGVLASDTELITAADSMFAATATSRPDDVAQRRR
ncbi:MAG: SUMF1/EgtB/PvdO family nonheme iron enzyme [Proteobacteria bacterium]|nr:SUMF1/EgtB/PvdO family nonheme iron enzyme [Pseudomonadota bacterium]